MGLMKKLFGKENRAADEEKKITSPMDGRLISLKEVPDEAFSGGILGDGAAILPEKGEVFAPADGRVDTVFDTGHAITLLCDNGAELLLHVGLDTVRLKGKYFELLVKAGERVKRGQLLLKADLAAIRQEGYETVTPVIVTNSSEWPVKAEKPGNVKAGDVILQRK